MLRWDATIVQDHANIVQTHLKRAYLDDFLSEFGRYCHPVCRNVAIFAPEMNKRMKMNLKKLLALATLLIIYGSNLSAKDYTVSSPNGKNVATVDKSLNITVPTLGPSREPEPLVSPSPFRHHSTGRERLISKENKST